MRISGESVFSKCKGPVVHWEQRRGQRHYNGVINGKPVRAEAREPMQGQITQVLRGHCRDFGYLLCSFFS